MRREKKPVVLGVVSVIDKSWIEHSRLIFIYVFVYPSKEYNSRLNSFSINYPTTWFCLCQLSRSCNVYFIEICVVM